MHTSHASAAVALTPTTVTDASDDGFVNAEVVAISETVFYSPESSTVCQQGIQDGHGFTRQLKRSRGFVHTVALSLDGRGEALKWMCSAGL